MTNRTSLASGSVDWATLKRESLRRALVKHVQGEILFDAGSQVLYSTDASIYQLRPLGVVAPRTIEALAATVAIAMDHQVPIIPRGAGTSLSGQSIGVGLVIDCSKYLDRVVDLNLEGRTVRVQPGCVLANLNKQLAPHGYQFGPDVATIDRANIGGMIGNNSAGARSVRFGRTIDHVRSLHVALTDGSRTNFEPIPEKVLRSKLALSSREGDIYRTVRRVLIEHREEIRGRYPKVFRRVSGYNLDSLDRDDHLDLSRLIVGSEGTLATVLEATLNIVPLPRYRGMGVLEFEGVDEALAAVPELLRSAPSAVELLDDFILDLARASREYSPQLDFLQGKPGAVLLVEYLEDDEGLIDRRLSELAERAQAGLPTNIFSTVDSPACERIWNIRKMSLPLLLSLPGASKPVTFVEDTAVDPDRLGEYVKRFRDILVRHGTTGSFYGHASVGCLHIRPILDLQSPYGIRQMEQIAEEVLELVTEFGGAMSGEHGDGLARSCFNPRIFGPVVYQAFQEIKQAFDPHRLMNPGKIVDAPSLSENLRSPAVPRIETKLGFHYEGDGGMLSVVDECNGNGLCRRRMTGVMCPSYMVTRDERHSPRGRANLLRSALAGELDPTRTGGLIHASVDEALDLCVSCKGCKTECPSSVDIGKLKAEYLYQRHRVIPPSRAKRMQADYATLGKQMSRWAPFSNILMRSGIARKWFYPSLGLDSRRKLPPFRRSTLERWFRQHKLMATKRVGEVVLLADCFTNLHEPQTGRSAVILLEMAGYQVHLAPLCCGRTMISAGFLDEARELVDRNLRSLAEHVDRGRPVLAVEPSCLAAITDEWIDLDSTGRASTVAEQADSVESFLHRVSQEDDSALLRCQSEPKPILVHGHCHQRAGGRLDRSVTALRNLASALPTVLDSGCCGMAGSFGYEDGHYEVSISMAEQRLLPAIRENPGVDIIAPGFSCRSQIRDLSGRIALHPIDFIRRRVGVGTK